QTVLAVVGVPAQQIHFERFALL
ncbi:MAG: hypothetical protein QOJ33_1673, partial [Chloroflexota bacterium]|nr:hypothetical protein [Chloroflexota bacterium]